MKFKKDVLASIEGALEIARGDLRVHVPIRYRLEFIEQFQIHPKFNVVGYAFYSMLPHIYEVFP